VRRQVAFDRLLARLFLPDQPSWVLKGGYALELLFDAARTTIDIDLTLPELNVTGGQPNDVIREMLQHAAGASLADWFEFTIAAPIIEALKVRKGKPLQSARNLVRDQKAGGSNTRPFQSNQRLTASSPSRNL
jgi:hypothetical protein